MIMNSDENNLFDDFGEIAQPPEIKLDKVTNSPETQVIKEEVNEIIKKRKQMIYVDSSGKTRRGLSKEELIAAQSVCNTEIAVARLLRISYRTYIKYAKLHGVYGAVSTRPKIKLPPKTRKYKLEKILGNQYDKAYPRGRLLKKLISSGKVTPKCNRCGFDKKREFDNEYALILNHLDKNVKNNSIDNLEVLCLNCYFTYIGNPFSNYKKKLFDCTRKMTKKDMVSLTKQ